MYIGPDGFPQNIQVNATSSTEIQVTWEELVEDQRRGNITRYEVVATSTKMETVTKQTNGPTLSLLLDSLQEYAEYNISVRAYTIVGPGPYSPHQVTHTFEDGEQIHVACFNSCFVSMNRFILHVLCPHVNLVQYKHVRY